jgi:hypothetical protein
MKRGFLDFLDPFNDPELFWQVISGPPCILGAPKFAEQLNEAMSIHVRK